MGGIRAVAIAAALWLPALPGRAGALTELSPQQRLDFDRPESWALKYFATGTLLSGFGPPDAPGLGALRLGLEAGNLPYLTAHQRTVGFDGTKQEDLNKLPVLARPRLTVGLPLGFSLAAAYLPPVRINGARPNLLAGSLGHEVLALGPARVGLRAYGQAGSVEGDLTCSKAAIASGDPVQNPLGCSSPSADRAYLRYGGLELGGALSLGPVEPHLTVAANYLDLDLDVHAQYAGLDDNTRLTTRGVTVSGAAGLGYQVVPRLRLAADAFYSPLTVARPGEPRHVEGLFNGRGLVEYQFF